MSLPNLSGTGRLTSDVELRFSASGLAIATIQLAFNSRKKDESGTWVDDAVFYIRGAAFKQLAESAAESLTKGTEVNVSGRLKTEQWEDKNGGGKRSAPALLIDAIGPNLAFATAKVNKVSRDSGGGGFGTPRPTGTDQIRGAADDPWGAAPVGQPSAEDEPPF